MHPLPLFSRSPWPKRAGRPAVLALVVACAAAILLAACGGTDPSAQSPPPTSKPPTRATASGAVLSAYREMWADLVIAADTSDYQSPLLPEHATGDALTLLVQGLARDQLHDIVTRGVTLHHPVVTSLSPATDPDRATVGDCFDDSKWIEYTTSGKRAENAPGGRRRTTADLTKVGGTWKVSELTVNATGSC
jgi:hypothetical protein